MNKLLQLLKLKPVRIALTIVALGVASYLGLDTQMVKDMFAESSVVTQPAPSVADAGL